MGTKMIRLFSPYIPKEAGEEAKKTIDSGWINTGKREKELRERLCEKFNFKHCIVTNSCTSALRLSLAVVGVKPEDEVITTPWTMIATNTAILEQFAKPVFADIDYNTLNINPNDIEHRITDKTKAIMVVHYAGYPCNLKEIRKIAFNNNLVVIEDAAQALGSKYYDKYIGEKGHFVCFSLQAVKIINSGDGGIISTVSKKAYKLLSKRCWFGIDKTDRIKNELGAFPFDITELGYKYNMNDISATLGIVGLNHFDEIYNKRQEIAKIYNEELETVQNIELLHYNKKHVSNYWMYPIHVNNRNRFARYMRKNKIEVGIHYHRNDIWSLFGPKRDLPNTEKVEHDIIHIPIHSDLTYKDVNYIIRKIKKW